MAMKQTALERATEFCEGAFGPFEVDIKPYAKIVAELIGGAEQDAVAELRPLLSELREYVSDGLSATRACEEELPDYKGDISSQHIAHLESMRDRLNRALSASGHGQSDGEK